MQAFRHHILKSLKDGGRSKYWLATHENMKGKCSPETVYRFLRGSHDTTVQHLEAMLGAVKSLDQIEPDTNPPE